MKNVLKNDEFESFAYNSQIKFISEQDKTIKDVELPQFYPSMQTIKIFSPEFLNKPEKKNNIEVKNSFQQQKIKKVFKIENVIQQKIQKHFSQHVQYEIDDNVNKYYIFSKQDMEKFSLNGQRNGENNNREIQQFYNIYFAKSETQQIKNQENKQQEIQMRKNVNIIESNFNYCQDKNQINIENEQNITQPKKNKIYDVAQTYHVLAHVNSQNNKKDGSQKNFFSFVDQKDQQQFQQQDYVIYQKDSKEDSQIYFEEFYQDTQNKVLLHKKKQQIHQIGPIYKIITQEVNLSDPLSFNRFRSFVTETSMPVQQNNKTLENKVQPKSRDFYKNTNRKQDQEISFDNMTQKSCTSNLSNLKSDAFKKMIIKKSTLQSQQQVQTAKSDTLGLKRQFTEQANKYFEEIINRSKNQNQIIEQILNNENKKSTKKSIQPYSRNFQTINITQKYIQNRNTLR